MEKSLNKRYCMITLLAQQIQKNAGKDVEKIKLDDLKKVRRSIYHKSMEGSKENKTRMVQI